MDPHRPVTVTGASGFIAKHVVRGLLEAGHAVRATIRRPERAGEVRAAVLPGLPPDAADRLSFATLDLERDAGWDGALAGAAALIHTASPFPLVAPKDEALLIRPAVEGTLRALRAARDAGVGRVVLTSSVAAVMYRRPLPADRPLDERDWTDPATPWLGAYPRSKTLAERAAWDFVARDGAGLALTVLNPGLVLGPPLDARHGASLALVERFLRGGIPLVPDFDLPVVDVRDVARLHVEALARPGTEGRRFLALDRSVPMPELAAILKAAHPDRPVPTRTAPNLLVRALGLVDAAARSVGPVLGLRHRFSNAAARAAYGLDFVPAETAIRAAAAHLVARA